MSKFALVCLSTLFLINYQFQTCDCVTTATVNTIHNRFMCNLRILSYWLACLVSGGLSDWCSAINIQHQKVPQCNVCNRFLVFGKLKMKCSYLLIKSDQASANPDAALVTPIQMYHMYFSFHGQLWSWTFLLLDWFGPSAGLEHWKAAGNFWVVGELLLKRKVNGTIWPRW